MATTPNLLSVAKIWDQGAHNAFTDLLRFDDRWWCTFREAADHGWSIGTINDSTHTLHLGDIVRDDKIVQGGLGV